MNKKRCYTMALGLLIAALLLTACSPQQQPTEQTNNPNSPLKGNISVSGA